MKRSVSDYFLIALKAVGMGSAEIVPGVSGGTIAFLTGIYEELLDSIKSVDLKALGVLRKGGLKAFWQHINGNFLAAVFAGMMFGVFGFAYVLNYMLANYPVLLWAFFFGLIAATVLFVGRQVEKWNAGAIVGFLLGGGAAFAFTALTQVETPQTWWFAGIAGIFAITAMILPGISGSFLLVILGQYSFVLGALDRKDFLVLGAVAVGCAIGLLTFSRAISYLFKQYRNTTIAVLTGVILGSINKIWPWRNVVEVYKDRHGEFKPLLEENVLPGVYESTITTAESTFLGVTEKPSYLIGAIAAIVLGFALVFVMELVSRRSKG